VIFHLPEPDQPVASLPVPIAPMLEKFILNSSPAFRRVSIVSPHAFPLLMSLLTIFAAKVMVKR